MTNPILLAVVAAVSIWTASQREGQFTEPAANAPVVDSQTTSSRSEVRRRRSTSAKSGTSGQATRREASAQTHSWSLAAGVLALTGFATLTYEIAWTRVFALTAGPSTYAFAATLATVIAGIAIGSVIGVLVAGVRKRKLV